MLTCSLTAHTVLRKKQMINRFKFGAIIIVLLLILFLANISRITGYLGDIANNDLMRFISLETSRADTSGLRETRQVFGVSQQNKAYREILEKLEEDGEEYNTVLLLEKAEYEFYMGNLEMSLQTLEFARNHYDMYTGSWLRPGIDRIDSHEKIVKESISKRIERYAKLLETE